MQTASSTLTEYLAAHPVAEHDRVAEPMSVTCSMVITIPLYAESENLLPLLHSLARQRGVAMDEFEVILIVNNSADDVKRMSAAFQDNQKTLRMLTQLQEGRVVESSYADDARLVEEIRASSLVLHWVDASSAARTRADNNVGLARELGCQVAAERLLTVGRPDGLIVISDGDVEAYPDMLEQVARAFERWPALVGAIGKQRCYYPQHDELAVRVKAWFDIERVVQRLWKLVRPDWARPPLPTVIEEVKFEESCAVFRASAWAAAGGFPQLAGGAGYLLGYRLAQLGPVETINATVHYPMRASQRTGVHDGIGWQVVRAEAAVLEQPVRRRGISFFEAHGQVLRSLNDHLSYNDFSVQYPRLSAAIPASLYAQLVAVTKTADGFAADLEGYFVFRSLMLEDIYPALERATELQRIDTALYDLVVRTAEAGVIPQPALTLIDQRCSQRLQMFRTCHSVAAEVLATPTPTTDQLRDRLHEQVPVLRNVMPPQQIDWVVDRVVTHGESIELALMESGLAHQIPECLLDGELLHAYVLAREVERILDEHE